MRNYELLAKLGGYQNKIDNAIEELQAERVIPRIWNHHYTVWNADPAEISNRLGWLHIAEVMKDNACYLKATTESIQVDGYTNILLLGMGGSSLAPEVFSKTFVRNEEYPELEILDSTDPGSILSYSDKLDLERTLFIVSTKSGGTVETLSFFKYFYNKVADKLGAKNAGEHFIAITDPGSHLVDIAKKYNFRETFLNDSTIGGRFSALSYFGLLPAALMGVNVPLLLDRAGNMMLACHDGYIGAQLGAIMGKLALAGRDKLTLVTSPALKAFGAWVEQLIAESTGKNGMGILPVDGESLYEPDVYGNDRLFIYMKIKGNDSLDEDIKKLHSFGHPVVWIELEDEYDLGGEFFRWEMATAVACYCLGINPFDQPNVESAKKLAREMVSEYHKTGELPVMIPKAEDSEIKIYSYVNGKTPEEVFKTFINQRGDNDYIAIQAYIQPTEEADKALQKFRHKLGKETGLATTLGYGPRFLHSTGQLHKGDSGNGIFIQITSDNILDVDIPDEAGMEKSTMTFGVLKESQVLGDLRAMMFAWRRVIRLHIGTDIVSGIKALMNMFSDLS
ncbi:glucose-6-phosphate isomerase [Candidatus Poribacteria bacterium]|nr:glucose-6-phosphate isomerase [Candidatus Poribacteria bacterium]